MRKISKYILDRLFSNRSLAILGADLLFILGCAFHAVYTDPQTTDNLWAKFSVTILVIVWLWMYVQWVWSGLDIIKANRDTINLCKELLKQIELDQKLIDAQQKLIVDYDLYPKEEVQKVKEGLETLIKEGRACLGN